MQVVVCEVDNAHAPLITQRLCAKPAVIEFQNEDGRSVRFICLCDNFNCCRNSYERKSSLNRFKALDRPRDTKMRLRFAIGVTTVFTGNEMN